MYLLKRFSKNTQMLNYLHICPMGTELLHANRRTVGQTWRS